MILELIARRGVRDAVPELWGMFAIAVWDTRDRVLWLVRDRLGKKPLYYGRAGDGAWLFGSELKSLRAYPGCPTAIDRDAVAALLRYGCIPAPASIYARHRQAAARPRGAARRTAASRSSSRTGGRAPSSKRRWRRAATIGDDGGDRRKARRCCATRSAAG